MILLDSSVSAATLFGSEFLGTAILLLLGVGVVANNLLPAAKGAGTGFLHINWGWGIGVLAGVYVAYKSGAHLNPAVTIGLLVAGKDFAPGVAPTFGHTVLYLAAELLGAMFGAFLAWLAYKQHYDADCDPALKLGTFSTGPAIRNYGWNVITEAIATFVLIIWVLLSGYTQSGLGPLGVALIVVGIGASLGGPTGYAINPARDLGPRIIHALVPIKGKGSSDWGYSWVPIVGPLLGAVVAGLVDRIFWA